MSALDRTAIRELVASGNLRDAVDRLRADLEGASADVFNQAVVLSARLEDVRKRTMRGTVTEGAAETARNQIAAAILDLVDEVAGEIATRPTSGSIAITHVSRTSAGPPEGGRRDVAAVAAPASVSTLHPPTVFLSYAKEDAARARAVFGALRDAGFLPWMDEGGLRIGQEWDRVLEAKVAECDYFVVLQTRTLAGRDFSYVHKEIGLALEKQRRARSGLVYLLPVRLDGGTPLPELAHLQHLTIQSAADVDVLIATIRDDFARRSRSAGT